jgi:hypothetical protein
LIVPIHCPAEAPYSYILSEALQLSKKINMSSEWAIPALTQTSTNFAPFETSLRRHLEGIGELRIIDSNYRVPLKEVVSKELIPKWITVTVTYLRFKTVMLVVADASNAKKGTGVL